MSGIIGGLGSKSGVIGTTEIPLIGTVGTGLPIYERGSVSNAFIMGGTPITSYDGYQANYVKIGAFVWYYFWFSKGSQTGVWTMSIPFAAKTSVSADHGKCFIITTVDGYWHTLQPNYCDAWLTTGRFYNSAGAITSAGGTARVSGTLTYEVETV